VFNLRPLCEVHRPFQADREWSQRVEPVLHDLGRLDPFAEPLANDHYLRVPAISCVSIPTCWNPSRSI